MTARRWLESDTEIEPALRALADFSGCQHENQQNQSDEVTPRCPASQQVGRQLCNDQHCDEGNEKPYALLQPEIHVLANGTVKHDESETAGEQQRSEQRSINIESAQDTREVTQRCRFAFKKL